MSLQLPEPATGHNAPYDLAPGLPFEYALADGVVGSALEVTEKTPKLFHPLKIKSMVLPNRVGVSPMCQCCADNNEVTDYHRIHYGGFSARGPGLIMIEATAVASNAGTSVVDLGIWKDSQAEKFRPIVQYAHANTAKIGIQLAHAGRKSMQSAMFEYLENWDPRGKKEELVAPSAITFRPGGRLPTPRELKIDEIHGLIEKFGAAAKRAVAVGFDFVEIHAAHGYLINEFMSSHSNKRTDEYGGSFENRIRFLLEVIESVKANIPKDYPLFLRWSGSELHDSNPEAWTVEDSVKLAPIVVAKGVDFIDVSAGGNDSGADRPKKGFGMFVDFARRIKEAVGDTAVVSAVGRMHDPVKINELLEQGIIDFALVGSPFLVNQGLVIDWAKAMGVEIHNAAPFWPLRAKYGEMIKYINDSKIRAESSKF